MMTKKQTERSGGKKPKKQNEGEKKDTVGQQFTEQMNQLSGPNYKQGEVGALEEDIKRRERMNQDGGVETKRHKHGRGRQAKGKASG